jgi:hypothetical protein
VRLAVKQQPDGRHGGGEHGERSDKYHEATAPDSGGILTFVGSVFFEKGVGVRGGGGRSDECRRGECGNGLGAGGGLLAGDLVIDPSQMFAQEGLLALEVAEAFAHGDKGIAATAGADGKTKKAPWLESHGA